MKFSIVIPLYNGANSITNTLDAVVAQTYKNYEVILVNDESPDNVADVVKKYITDHPQIDIVYLEQKNKGLGGARNTAIRNANGDIIAVLDQDDIWYPEKLEKVASIYKNNPDVSIVCHNQYIRERGEIKSVVINGPYEKDMHRKLLFGENCLSTSATTFKKSLIEDVGCFSEEVNKMHFIEDYDLWMRMAQKGYKFLFMPEILGEYVLHESNNSSNYEAMYLGELYVIDKHYDLLKERRYFDWYRLRSKKAKMLYFISHYFFFIKQDIGRAILYLMMSLGSDPLFIVKNLWRKIKLKMEAKQ